MMEHEGVFVHVFILPLFVGPNMGVVIGIKYLLTLRGISLFCIVQLYVRPTNLISPERMIVELSIFPFKMSSLKFIKNRIGIKFPRFITFGIQLVFVICKTHSEYYH